jgi:vesicle transport through interaction with t-SNAREs protein 1
VDENVAKSRRMLNSMSQRMERHKWVIGVIIVVLILAIMLIIYVKTRK